MREYMQVLNADETRVKIMRTKKYKHEKDTSYD